MGPQPGPSSSGAIPEQENRNPWSGKAEEQSREAEKTGGQREEKADKGSCSPQCKHRPGKQKPSPGNEHKCWRGNLPRTKALYQIDLS